MQPGTFQQREGELGDEGGGVAFEVREDLEGTGACQNTERGKGVDDN